MRLQPNLLVITGLFTALLHSPAIAAGNEQEYKNPDEITVAERRFLIQAGSSYQACLATELPTIKTDSNDPRQLADLAMHACDSVLTEFDDEMEQRNFSPSFREHQLKRVQQQAVRGLIAQATHIAASRQQKSQTD
ncbi:MAG: hypothetical protein WD572_06860 [Gammaproteobacteria bacterium]